MGQIKFTVFPGKDSKFYWRAKTKNGRVVADGAQGYVSRRNADRAARSFIFAIREHPPTVRLIKVRDDTKA